MKTGRTLGMDQYKKIQSAHNNLRAKVPRRPAHLYKSPFEKVVDKYVGEGTAPTLVRVFMVLVFLYCASLVVRAMISMRSRGKNKQGPLD